MLRFRWLLFMTCIPFIGLSFMVAVYAVFSTLNRSCASEACTQQSNPFIGPLKPIREIAEAIPIPLAACLLVGFVSIFVSFGVSILRHDTRTGLPTEMPRKNVAAVPTVGKVLNTPAPTINTHPPAADKEADNMRDVVGWQYALSEGSISRSDLKNMAPDELQDRIDMANPLAEEVYQLRELIPVFAGAEDKANRRRHATMVRLLKDLREQPEEIHRKARALEADEAIEDAHAAILSVEKLEEG